MAHGYLCGCYYTINSTDYYARFTKHYLPLLDSSAHSTILSTTSRTVLTQTFTNSTTSRIKECIYTFPLYDGVSVVGFTCRIGKKVLTGLVKEKYKAKQIFDEAVAKGETAGLLEQTPEASDVFSTKLGNIPAGQSIIVEITYIGELKHTETEGIRFTIPTSIAPRYGSGPAATSNIQPNTNQGIKITVDINMPEGSFIKGVQSPSHPIAVSMGTISTAVNADPTMSKASATLSLGTSALEKDFVLIVSSKDVGIPKALLEIHPTIPNHRALMATLVPKFSLPPSRPEIVFVADRSGSMAGHANKMLIQALNLLLKSMPIGVKFNICSFGSTNSFLWSKSKPYSAETLDEATRHVNTFSANMGGTETYLALKNTIDRRFSDIPLEIILLTDGDVWHQEAMFKYLNDQVEQTNGNIRVFPLGIGNGVSHSLIEGIARAGNGFASAVQNGERLDAPVVRMLRGALSPHITNYTLEVKYEKQDDEFEVIEKVTEGMRVLLSEEVKAEVPKATISLFDTTVNPEKDDIKANDDPHAHLPNIPIPHLHQAPHKIPSLFAFSRTSIYLLLSPEIIQRNPTSVILRATSEHGPLALEIPIEVLSEPGTTIHQLAAKKAVQDLEEGRGWLYDAKDQNDKFVKERYPSCFDELIEKEAVRLGEKFQIAGKWTSFVAVASNDKEIAAKAKEVAKAVEESAEEEDEDEDEDGSGVKRKRRVGRNQVFDVEAEVDEDEEDSDDYAEAAQRYVTGSPVVTPVNRFSSPMVGQISSNAPAATLPFIGYTFKRFEAVTNQSDDGSASRSSTPPSGHSKNVAAIPDLGTPFPVDAVLDSVNSTTKRARSSYTQEYGRSLGFGGKSPAIDPNAMDSTVPEDSYIPYSPVSPGYSPTSPQFSPTEAFGGAAGEHNSPVFHPESPSYSPVSAAFSTASELDASVLAEVLRSRYSRETEDSGKFDFSENGDLVECDANDESMTDFDSSQPPGAQPVPSEGHEKPRMMRMADRRLDMGISARASASQSQQNNIGHLIARGEGNYSLAQNSEDLAKSATVFRKKAKAKSSNPFAGAVAGAREMFGGPNSKSSSSGARGGGGRGGGMLASAVLSAPGVSFSQYAPAQQSQTVQQPPTIGTGPSNLFGVMAGQGTPHSQQPPNISNPASQFNPTSLYGGAMLSASKGIGNYEEDDEMEESLTTSSRHHPSRQAPPAPPMASQPSNSSAPAASYTAGSESFETSKKTRNAGASARFRQRSSKSTEVPPPVPAHKVQTPAEKVLSLISMQDFTGCWDISTKPSGNDLKAISEILGFEVPAVPKELEGSVDLKAWVTMIVVKVLEEKMAEEEGTWGLVVEKARGWLGGLKWGDVVKELGELEKSAGEVVEKGWVDV